MTRSRLDCRYADGAIDPAWHTENPMKNTESPIISALSYEGLTAVTADGKPASFAIIDEDGNVIAAGEEVAKAAWKTSINAYRDFLMGQGHMRSYTKAEALALSVANGVHIESD